MEFSREALMVRIEAVKIPTMKKEKGLYLSTIV
jgi:hypothetical protein